MIFRLKPEATGTRQVQARGGFRLQAEGRGYVALTRRHSCAWLLRFALACALATSVSAASHVGQVVTAGNVPVPGALITATQGDRRLTATTDGQGAYSFSNLAEGAWVIRVEMLGFVTDESIVTIP